MYQHVATQANIETLRARGNIFIGPDSGRLACGTTGKGRMIDPQKIVEAAVALVGREEDFAGTRVLISSGRNHEPIDPVRYIANRSSGKMGRALAMEGLSRGAEVTVVSGPADVSMPYGVTETRVTTALEMRDAVLRQLPEADVFISVAAVADYRVKTPAASKRKRGDGQVSLELVENPDILAEAGSRKLPDQVLVGFAAETDDLSENAADKLRKKKVDLMVANQVGTEESGFGTDTLRAQFISRDGAAEDLGLIPKEELAARLFDYVRVLRDARKTSH